MTRSFISTSLKANIHTDCRSVPITVAFFPFAIIIVCHGKGEEIVKAALLSFMLVMLAGCGDYHRDYLERTAGFALPHGTITGGHFTGADIGFTSGYLLPPDSIAAFASRACLEAEPSERWASPMFTEELPVPWNEFPSGGEFLYGDGTTGWNGWNIVLHLETGLMWATVTLTDMAGDPPP
jgi:hypothetical protein